MNCDNWFEWANSINIYQPHTHKNGVTYYGAAAFNTRISDAEGFSHFLEEQEVGKFVFNFSDYYCEEIMRFDESDTFLNLDRAGVGNEKRNIFRVFANLNNELEMQKMLMNIDNSLRSEQDIRKFHEQLRYIKISNYKLDGEIINPPVKEVW